MLYPFGNLFFLKSKVKKKFKVKSSSKIKVQKVKLSPFSLDQVDSSLVISLLSPIGIGQEPGQDDLPEYWLQHLSLVSRHGERELRGPRDCGHHEPALHQHQGGQGGETRRGQGGLN